MFTRQIFNLGFVAYTLVMFSLLDYGFMKDSPGLLGLSAQSWLWLALLMAIIHQLYVALVWRLELYGGHVTRLLGPKAKDWYVIGFFVLFAARILGVMGLAVAGVGHGWAGGAVDYPGGLHHVFCGTLLWLGPGHRPGSL